NVGSIDALSLAAGGDNSFGVSGGSAVGAGTGAIEPALPAGSIKIPLSAYVRESTSSRLLASFYNSIPNGYHVYRHTDGRDYLTPDDPTTPSAFQHKDGWYVSNDGKLAIGQDDAKDLAVTSTAKASNYPDDGSVAKIVNPNPNLKVFGSDNADKITVDGAKIESVYGGVGNDNVDLKDGAETIGISGGSGEDKISVDNSKVTSDILGGSEDDIIKVSNNSEVKNIGGNDGMDTINVENATVRGNIRGGAGDDVITAKGSSSINNILGDAGKDTITLEDGAKVVGQIRGDTKTMNDIYEKQVNPALDIVDSGADADTITLSGAGTSAQHIFGGDGADIITVKNGAKVTGEVRGDEGGDKITVSGDQTYVSAINGRGGDDTILVEKGANVDGIVGRWGNDSITVTGKGTTVKEYIHGDDGDDTIKVLDGAVVKGDIEGNAGNDIIEIDGGANKEGFVGGKIISGDGDDIVTIRNTDLNKINNDYNKNVKVDTGTGNDTVNLHNVVVNDTNIWTKEGDDTVNTTDTIFKTTSITQGTGIGTGSGNDIININSGSNFESGTHISAGEGNDNININNGAHLNGGHVYGYEGNDTININSGATLTNSSVRGNEGNDTISIDNGASINNSGNIALNGDEGNDTLVLKNGASSGFNNLNFENKVSLTHTNGDVNITDMEGDKTVDLSQLSAITDNNVKSIDMTGVNGAKLNITAQDVLDANKTTGDTLTVKGGSDDTVHKTDTSSWQNNNDGTYSTTVNGETVSIKIENNITLDL
ncbi:hypothetical protein, partial [Campylobacter concisus]